MDDFYVVSYLDSTSNHNTHIVTLNKVIVVSYLDSTSNHNCHVLSLAPRHVVSYLDSTSNHNYGRDCERIG